MKVLYRESKVSRVVDVSLKMKHIRRADTSREIPYLRAYHRSDETIQTSFWIALV